MHKINKGFTLIELLITLLIAAVLVTIAIPNFSGLIQNNRLISQTNSLIADLNYARSESIKRRAAITITPSGGNWHNGWRIKPTDADDSDFLRLASATAQGLSINTEGGNTITFLSSGNTTNNSLSSLTLCDTRGDDFARVLSIEITGRIALSNEDANCT